MDRLPAMRALVTGGAGFIGSHLVDALVAGGRRRARRRRPVVGSPGEPRRRRWPAAPGWPRPTWPTPRRCEAPFAEHRPELVFHLAAQIDVRRSVADPSFDLAVNVAGTINMLDAARANDSRRFLFASTGGAIYGEGEGRELPLGEEAECLPDAPYGQSKLAAEGYLGLYARLYGVSSAALRLGNVYGPRQDPHGEAGVVAIFSRALLDGGRPRVFGDGGQTRDYISVDDVVRAFLAAAAGDAPGAFNAGTGKETSVLELGAALAGLCDREFDPEMAPARAGEVQRISIDSSRARKELGWTAETGLEAGLRVTVDSFRS